VDTSFPAAGAVLAASAAWTGEVEEALRDLGGPARHEAFRELLVVGGNVKFDLMRAAQPDERRRTVVADDVLEATDDAEELGRRAFAEEASRADDASKNGARRGISQAVHASSGKAWRALEQKLAGRIGAYVAALASRPGARRVLAAQALVSQGVLQRDVAQLMRAHGTGVRRPLSRGRVPVVPGTRSLPRTTSSGPSGPSTAGRPTVRRGTRSSKGGGAPWCARPRGSRSPTASVTRRRARAASSWRR